MQASENSYRSMLEATAKSLRDSFPSYKHLTIGDLVFGLGCLAKEHSKQDLVKRLLEEPVLYDRKPEEEQVTDQEFKWWHENSPSDGDSFLEQIKFSRRMIYYANLSYYNVVNESERTRIKQIIDEASESIKSSSWFSSQTPKYDQATLDNLLTLKFESNLLYSIHESQANQQSFFLKLDHEIKSVVIAIRGTASIADVFTNLSIENSKLKVHRFYGDYKRNLTKREHLKDFLTPSIVSSQNVEDFFEYDQNEEMIEGEVHVGYIRTAQWILEKIESILLNQIYSNQSIYKDYRIVCVGHSLGGGLATLVSILLRELFLNRLKNYWINGKESETEPPMPDIDALTYAPCAIFSENLSNWSRSFVTSIIIGLDIVPRLSLGQAEKLRLEINATNWEEKLATFMSEHKKIHKAATALDGYLVDWGYAPIFQTRKSLITNNQAESLQQVGASSTMLEELNKLNATITTLYPPGVLFQISPNFEEMREKRNDISEAIFDLVNEKLFEEKTSQHKDESNETKEDGMITSLFSVAKKVFETVKTNYSEVNSLNGSSDSVDFFDINTFSNNGQPTGEAAMLYRVDVTQFDRIVLSRFMFSHHRLVGFKTFLDTISINALPSHSRK